MKALLQQKNRVIIGSGILLLLAAAAGAYWSFSALVAAIERNGPLADALRSQVAESAVLFAAYGIAALLIVLLILNRLQRVTARHLRTQQRLDALLTAAEQAQGLITVLDRRGRIAYINRAVEIATGYSRKELVGRRRSSWLPWYGDKRTQKEPRNAAFSGKPFRAALKAVNKTGELFYLDELITPMTDEEGKILRYISTAIDITYQKGLEDSVERLGRYDSLTGLPNRLYFATMLEQAVISARSENRFFSALVVDIDRFKNINDLFGPETGDHILAQVAEKLRSAVGEHDIVARLGSDEFAVIRFHERPGDAVFVAENIRTALAQAMLVGDQELVVTVSTGIAVFPDNGADARNLLRNADLALAKAKAQGRNAILSFEEGLGDGLSDFYFLEKRLFSALKNREYLVHYQPTCELMSKTCTGAEALIAWNNPDLGIVSPSKFIPSLEDTGMIIDVGRWVLETACGQIREWQTKKRIFPVSVNLSFAQFHHRDLVRLVSETIDGFRLDPRHLTLEVTESVFIRDVDFAVTILKRLKDVGVLLSIDDFGTGYSSLSYLKKLPVDIVKIDMSFVQEVTRDQDAASIVSAITTLARSLNLKTIAEGVETEEQRNILHLLRCDMGQGYYFSPALPPAELEKFITARQPGA